MNNEIALALTGWTGPVGLDTETTGLDPLTDQVRLLQVAVGEDVAVIDLSALPDPVADLAPLFKALAGKEVIGRNLQFDLRFLAPRGFVPGKVFDTMLASRVLDAGDREESNARLKHALCEVVERELGRTPDKDEQKSDWSEALTTKQIAYAAADAEVLLPLAESLKEKLAAANLTATADVEMRALPGVAWAVPIAVDVPAWLAISDGAEAERRRLAEEMDTAAPNPAGLPGMESYNWDSPAQVKEAFAQVALLRSTDPRVLMLCARQVGKSSVVSILALKTALTQPGTTTTLVAPVEEQATELLRKVMTAYNAIGRPVPVLRESATRLELAYGSRVLALPGKERRMRSYTSSLLIIDEAARVPDDVVNAASPTMAVSKGRFVALSTAFAKSGWFYDQWQDAAEPYLRLSITAQPCPRIPGAFLAGERRKLGARWFDMEYMNVFGDDIAAVFSSEDIRRAVRADVLPLFDKAKSVGAPAGVILPTVKPLFGGKS